MAEPIEELMRAESRLTRSFVGAVIGAVLGVGWMFVGTRPPAGTTDLDPAAVGLALVQFGFYIWYAISAGAAAKLLGDKGWKYVVWILAAPFLARIPIPIVSTLIAVSPLSIKFLLGGQLQTAIRQEGIAAIR
jgi:hypothetical protein